MASAKKKLDEKNLKILRELVSRPENKHCFDCKQRGPTYINMTIGSFVCTTCSGMLRGLTPPHRVKSISMATFNQEEIEFISARGNEYARKVWLGLCDQEQLSKDEQQIKDFMISKYERKRYYLKGGENEFLAQNGNVNKNVNVQPSVNIQPIPKIPPLNYNLAHMTNGGVHNNNNNNNLKSSKNNNLSMEPNIQTAKNGGNFADPFSPINFNSSSFQVKNPAADPGVNQQTTNFANFDNNPVFSPTQSGTPDPPPPSEDRYAALKALDSLMKSQVETTNVVQTQQSNEWGANLSWPNVFETSNDDINQSSVCNPFSTSFENGWKTASQFVGNPFKAEISWSTATNGFANHPFNTIKPVWETEMPNPFTVGTNGQTTNHHSSNPFL